ncbi:MAG: hypothetical protein L0H70_04150 [Xanthomonadales bacterium]|nr:hypothetical protein [Xanthomonadales bacterium]
MMLALGNIQTHARAASVRDVARRAAQELGSMGQMALLLGPRGVVVAVGYTDHAWRHAIARTSSLVGVYRDPFDLPENESESKKRLQAQLRDDLYQHLREAA